VVAVFTESGIDSEDPIADAGADQTVDVDTTVVFDATNSSDDVDIVTYEWDFGDGATGTGAVTTHTYATPGSYVVTLTVWDTMDNQDEDVLVVVVAEEAAAFQLEWWMFVVAIALVFGLAGVIYAVRSR
jgi:PKD repeat protein